MKITIIDYGAGNIRNVFRAIDQLGVKPIISADPKDILSSDGVILPGVGAAQDTMNHLSEKNLIEPIKQYINANNYFFHETINNLVHIWYFLTNHNFKIDSFTNNMTARSHTFLETV